MPKYKIEFLTDEENDFLRVEVLQYKAKVKKLIRRDEFPSKEFRSYLEDREHDLTPSQLYNFVIGRTVNKAWIECLKGYYYYIKEFGYKNY